jgi:hypothetical protein
VQLEKVEGGIKVTTDKGDEIITDAVMFATGELQLGKLHDVFWGYKSVGHVIFTLSAMFWHALA